MYFDFVLVYYHQTRKQQRTPTPNREPRTQLNQQWEEVGAIQSVARVAVGVRFFWGEDEPVMRLPCWLLSQLIT